FKATALFIKTAFGFYGFESSKHKRRCNDGLILSGVLTILRNVNDNYAIYHSCPFMSTCKALFRLSLNDL
ncbi:Hypothetical predicted protein, partial [Mytilus galloprovincialis]